MAGFCPGGFVQGDFVRGDFVLGGILSRGILSGGFCPGGFCPGGFCPRTLKYIVLTLFGKLLESVPCLRSRKFSLSLVYSARSDLPFAHVKYTIILFFLKFICLIDQKIKITKK